jgi:hypothetical protein
MTHPNYETLLNYSENKLSPVEKTEVDEHLSLPCPVCKNKVAQLRTLFNLMAKDKTVAPPANVLSRAIAAHRKQKNTMPHPILRALATLQFDSRLQLSAMASRGAARTHQVLYTAQHVDIDLKITPEHGEHNLVGQVLADEKSDDLSTAFVTLQDKAGEMLQGVETDSFGQFAFRQVPSGTYDLLFDLGGQEVSINSLELSND